MPRRPAGVTYRTAMAAINVAHQSTQEIVKTQTKLRRQTNELRELLRRVIANDLERKSAARNARDGDG